MCFFSFVFYLMMCGAAGGGEVIIYRNDINHHQNLLILKTCATKNLPFLFISVLLFVLVFVLTQQFCR